MKETNIHKSRGYEEGRNKPLRNMESSEEDLKRRGANDWKTKTGNRMDWRSEVEAVKDGIRF